MERSPGEDRQVLVQQIVSGLNGLQGRVVLEKFDAEKGTILVLCYPDDTKQDDAANRFLVKVEHQLRPSAR
jgi:hypothetical protein